jgi:hypothetical protein
LDGEAVKREVLVAFEYSFNQEDWVCPLTEALAGVTAQEATWRPSPDVKSIWEIVLHMAVWTENMVHRMQSGDPVRPAEGAWPPLPPTLDEAAWEQAQRRLWEALAGLRAQIEATLPTALLDGPYGLADLLCRFIHIAYHIGQITKLREWRAAQAATA